VTVKSTISPIRLHEIHAHHAAVMATKEYMEAREKWCEAKVNSNGKESSRSGKMVLYHLRPTFF